MSQLFVSSCKIPFGQATPDEESDKIKELEDCANVAISCCEGWSSVEAKGLRLYTVIHFVIEALFCYAGVLCVCVCDDSMTLINECMSCIDPYI